MTPQERAAWCIAQAEVMEKDLSPQEGPHLWGMRLVCAKFWRDMAARVLASHGLGPWPSEDKYWETF